MTTPNRPYFVDESVQKGWMSRHGHRLTADPATRLFTCPESGWRYRLNEAGDLKCLDWPEDQALS